MVRSIIQILLLAFLLKEAAIRFAVNDPSPEPIQVLATPVSVVKRIQERSLLRPERITAPVEATPTPQEQDEAMVQAACLKLMQVVPVFLEKVQDKLNQLPPVPPPQPEPTPPPEVKEEPKPAPVQEIPKAEPTRPVLVDWVDSYSEAKQQAIDLKRPILISFSETGCYYCEYLKANTYKNPKVKEHLASNFILQRVFLSKESGVSSTPGAQSFVDRFGVSRWPTVVVYNPATNTYKKAAPSSMSFYDPNTFITTVDSLAANVK